MSDPISDELQLRIIGEEALVAELAKALASHNCQVTVEQVHDPARLNLDLQTVFALLALIPILLTERAVFPALWEYLRQKKNRGTVIIESPLGRVEFKPNQDLTDDELRLAIRRLSGLL